MALFHVLSTILVLVSGPANAQEVKGCWDWDEGYGPPINPREGGALSQRYCFQDEGKVLSYAILYNGPEDWDGLSEELNYVVDGGRVSIFGGEVGASYPVLNCAVEVSEATLTLFDCSEGVADWVFQRNDKAPTP